MKYTLENIFDELNPNELDEIMPDDFDAKLPKGALRRIEKTALQRSGIKNNRRHFNFKIFAPVAACLVLMAGIGGYAIAAEAREYNAAVDFFAQNGLSAEGLSREDLKAVYRDITTNRFVNDKTVEVIKRSVPGVEILQEEPTPEELSILWNSNMNNFAATPYIGINYFAWTKWKYDETLDFDVFDKSVVDCYNNGETIWSTEISSFCVYDCLLTSNGTAAWGYTSRWSGEQPSPAWLARLDDNGNKLWEHRLDHGFWSENITAVVDNGDGTWAVFSSGFTREDIQYLCLSQYDINGNELSFTKTRIDNKGIWKAVCLGDDYLVQLGSCANGEKAHFAKLDKAGNITDNFVYESDDCDYYITDMTEFEGNVYLSAYAVPKNKNNDIYRDGLFEILDNIISEKGNYDVSPEELTPAVREHYTAVLLLCEPNGGEPKRFYSAKSSLGGALAVENNQLKWNVENVIMVGYLPYVNSFPISGNCLVYRYSFDENGVLVGCEDTGKVVGFHR